jgi:hypothetical protein
MRSLLSALSLILLLAIIPRCATPVSQEVILCDPPQAEIHWGKTESSLEKTPLKTPNTRSVSAQKLESWCYQVRKTGYHDSQITCREEEGFRYLDFRLIPLRTEVTSEPPEAIIYCGPAQDRLERTDYRTPKTLTVKELPPSFRSSAWEDGYLQVKKEGYQDSEIIFLPRQQEDRKIHLKLVPVTR